MPTFAVPVTRLHKAQNETKLRRIQAVYYIILYSSIDFSLVMQVPEPLETGSEICLSCSRVDLDRLQREPSS